MSLQVEKLEHNMAKLTIEVEAEEFTKAMKEAYNKQKGSISLPGFRKGKVPMAYLEKIYGPEMFYEDAANIVLPKAYENAATESELEITSAPKIDVTQMEKGKSFIFTAEVALKPDVTLGEYKGLEVPKTVVEVTDEDISAELVKEQEKNAREITVEDRPVQDKDIVNIDYAGSVDGVAFDGGTAEGQPLVIGSHSFIDTFEEQLIGHNIGDDVDVNVTFPEEYHAPDLAGKPALFKVKINGIKAKELPAIDDDFAQDVSEFDSLEEYKEDIKKKLLDQKENAARTDKENAVVDKVIENASMDIPQPMIDSQTEQMAEEFAQRIQYQGLTLDQYFQFTGTSREKMLEDLQPQAKKSIETRLVLEAIVDAEKIEATDEDLDEELGKMAAMYQMEVEQIKTILGDDQKDAMRRDIAVQKAVTFLSEQAKEV
ncbi:MAG: trigger factor [Lachnospiraceae bacterium]|nr:trigger factor [Lachnospiraceae bacterium]